MKVATDIGGTFTDVVTLERNGIRGWKVLSTPGAPDHAVTGTLKELNGLTSFSHGTTVATNALLERKGAKVALVTTKGFRDLLFIARQQRPRLYDFDCHRPLPLVPPHLCFEIDERLRPDGSVSTSLSQDKLENLVEQVVNSGAEIVAVCLLYSYQNPNHELALEKIFQERGVPVSRSSEIIPEFREFERASTVTMNAFVQPGVQSYLTKIRKAMATAKGPDDYFIMKSGGGVATSREVYPVELLLSGPAGGVSGAVLLGEKLGRSDLVTFDMGGTSADFSAIVNGAPLRTDEGEIAGLPLRLPVLDITTVGAGGGSVAWIDSGGVLRVGPQSAGSDPGPACYDRGGALPTVTDANFLAGLLSPRSFKHSGIRLNQKRALEAIESLAGHAGLNVEQTILGIRSVVNANMQRGIRKATVEKGIDVRDCSLLAFGGAGPLHATELAQELGIREIIVPPMAGMFSALGILLSDVRLDYGKSVLAAWDMTTKSLIQQTLEKFRKRAIHSLTRQGFKETEALYSTAIDMRYVGQSFHLSVPYNNGRDSVSLFRDAFTHRYGYCLEEDYPIEIVAIRLSVRVPRKDLDFPDAPSGAIPPAIGEKNILFSNGRHRTPVFQRDQLSSRFSRNGPLVIQDEGSTVYVPSKASVSLGRYGCLMINIDEGYARKCPSMDQKDRPR